MFQVVGVCRLVALSLLFVFGPSVAVDCVSVGAIRWDAWHGRKEGAVGEVVEKTLSSPGFRSRSPFCSIDTGDGFLDINCSTPAAMEQEILYARSSGLSYWAFLKYPDDNPMSLSLKRYLASENQNIINFSLVLTPKSIFDSKYEHGINVVALGNFAARPNFQRVLGGRPIFFFLPEGGFLEQEGNIALTNGAFKYFRKYLLKSGQGNPYFVLMHFNAELGGRLVKRLGFDALSTYAIHGNGKGAPYNELTKDAYKFWDRAKASGSKFVPTAMAGWDRRPRVIRPVPWESGQVFRQDEIEFFYQEPRPEELSEHVVEAMRWVKRNSVIAEANTVLVYAWNENDEGGWIIPTLGEGDGRVRALGAAIVKECHHGN